MALPPGDADAVQRWCAARVPVHQQDRVRVTCEVGALHLTICEEHPPWDGGGEWTSTPVARLRWTQSHAEWSLFCVGGNGDFRPYDSVRSPRSVGPLLEAVDRDDTGIFWG